MTNLDSILKSRDITLPTKFRLVKAIVFPVVIYGCESRTVKKAECWRIDAFELWCWRRLLWVPWTARRSNQSILKEIGPGCSLEGMMLKLKLQYFGHLMQSWLIGKDSDDGRDWGQEEKGMTEDEMAGWHHRLDGRESEWTPGVGDGQGGLACCDSWGCKESDTTEPLNWTEKWQWIWWLIHCRPSRTFVTFRSSLPKPTSTSPSTGIAFVFHKGNTSQQIAPLLAPPSQEVVSFPSSFLLSCWKGSGTLFLSAVLSLVLWDPPHPPSHPPWHHQY